MLIFQRVTVFISQPEVITLLMFLHSMCKVVAVHLHVSASTLVD
jgi:hypothetical protein